MDDLLAPRRLLAAACLLVQAVGIAAIAMPGPVSAGGILLASVLVGLAIRADGFGVLQGTMVWWIWPIAPVRVLAMGDDDLAGGRHQGPDREAGTQIAAILAGGDASRIVAGGSPDLSAAFRQHRMGRSEGDGSTGWWIDVPADAGFVQLRAQASTGAAVVVHVAVGGVWVDGAGPAEPVLVHRCELAAGQVFVRVALAEPTAAGALLELWIEPPPAGAAAGTVAAAPLAA